MQREAPSDKILRKFRNVAFTPKIN